MLLALTVALSINQLTREINISKAVEEEDKRGDKRRQEETRGDKRREREREKERERERERHVKRITRKSRFSVISTKHQT